MGGSGGGGVFTYRTAEQLSKRLSDTIEDTAVREFETSLGELLSQKLSAANARDVPTVAERLGEIKELLADQLESSVDTLFGGSVAKHTYVDGLSDIDSLLIFDETIAGLGPPSKIIKTIAEEIEASDKSLDVKAGRLAVTVKYSDGMEIQLLPATKVDGRLRVPSFLRDGWSNIAPEKFQRALSARNDECGGKLVPTIKLAKAVIGALPDQQKLTGYHVESLAIAAFKGYAGQKTPAAMLPHFFERSRDLIGEPIRDSTGQSIHVDAYLGAAGSPERLAAAHVMGRIAKRMRNASAHQSPEQWEALFGEF